MSICRNMEIIVLDRGTLPAETVLSVRAGAVRRQMRMDMGKPMTVPMPSTKEDAPPVEDDPAGAIKFDVLAELGQQTLEYTPENGSYEVSIKTGGSSDCKLKLQIRFLGDGAQPQKSSQSVMSSPAVSEFNLAQHNSGGSSPVHKVSAAMGMRNYLDDHNLVNCMQGLLQDMLAERPADPLEFMMESLAKKGAALPAPQEPAKVPMPSPRASEGADPEEDPEDSDDGNDEPVEAIPQSRPSVAMCGFGRKRREGVSAEATQKTDANYLPPIYEKEEGERRNLADMIQHSHDSKLHMLFGSVQPPVFEKIIDAMQLKAVRKGENVIEQGAVGDFFYIVKNGFFDIIVKKGKAEAKKVFEAGAGFAFGELALLYNAPRSATIQAQEDSEVWALDRTAFRNLVVKSAEDQFQRYVEFLSNCDIFAGLSDHERATLAEVLEEETFEDDEGIVEQGEKDDKMFIIKDGAAVACIRGEQGEVEVMQYKVGSYFGEIALMMGEPRKASVYAVGQTVCLYITRETFTRVLGGLKDILSRNMDKYSKYQDAIQAAESETAEEPAAEAEDEAPELPSSPSAEAQTRGSIFQASGKKSAKFCKVKRDRTAQVMEGVEKAAHAAKEKEKEPTSLKEKVEMDFANPALVKPNEAFRLTTPAIVSFGGIKIGQKFTMDKPIITRASAGCMSSADEDDMIYSWNSPVKIKNSVLTAVLCQKGQKSAADPTPNQDNYFVISVQDSNKHTINLYGVADGHGPFGHLVSFRLVQSLPKFIIESPHFASKDYEAALKEGFLAAHAELEKFAEEQDINIGASGAAGSVMIWEEQNIHIAFIGDARIMLGSWNKRDSHCIFCTKDHKPELPEEKARLEAAGSEVREPTPGCGSYRIYQKGSSYPGLTMSRAFGDNACDGVLREPEYHKYTMQPTDEWYAVVASDGVWEFLEGEDVVRLTSKKLRLKGPRETVKFLVDASRKRWKHFEDDYCDDITAILVQFNNHEKTSNTNHTLVVNTKNNDPECGS